MSAIACREETRKSAKERFEALPWPVKTDEEWRRTDPAAIPFGAVELHAGGSPLQSGMDALPAEAARAGVLWTDLKTALRDHAELVERHLFQSGEAKKLAKFAALHQAECGQGLFCYVPDGVRVEAPLNAWCQPARGGVALYPHTLVVLGRQSELTLVDERRPGAGGAATFSDEMVELALGPESKLRYVRLQRWNSSVSEVFSQRAVLQRGADLLNITVALGGALTKANVETILEGSDSRAELLGILFGGAKQHFDFHTLQDHRAERTFSDLLFKSALRDQAKSIYTGLIRIEKRAQKSDAYQANRNLLLSEGAKADSVPMLEILADDVRCTHGVAVGPVDPDQAFYLTSRGIPEAETQRLIVQGFFEQVMRRIPLPALQEQLDGEVVRRLEENHG